MKATRIYLWSMIGFLTLSALIAIVALLSGEFGNTQAKVLLTTLTISGASICAMACSAFIEKRGLVLVGGFGVATAALAALLLIIAIWMDFNDVFGRVAVTALIVAIGFAHVLLLYIPRLAPGYRWSGAAAAVFITLLAAMLVWLLWTDSWDTGPYRLLGVLAVMVVLFTLIVPLCARLGVGAAAPEALVLTPDGDSGAYRDPAGNRYSVTRIG